MVESIQKFLCELIWNPGAGAFLSMPQFAEDRAAWSPILRVLDRWRLHPLLIERLSHAAWANRLPEAVQLQLQERQSRSRLLQSAVKAETELLLRLLHRGGVRLALLGTGALRYQLGLNVLTDSTLIEIAVRETGTALAILGRRGYRVSGSAGIKTVELRHRASSNRLRLDLSAREETWAHAEREILLGTPVDCLGAEEVARAIVSFGNWEHSPDALLQLRMIAPSSREIALLRSSELLNAWLHEIPPAPAQRWFNGISKLLRAWARSAEIS